MSRPVVVYTTVILSGKISRNFERGNDIQK
jgi:hypothetical protein